MFVGAAVMTEGKSQYQWGVYGSYCQSVLKTLGVQQQRTAHNGQCVHPHQQTKKINKKKLELVPGVATALNAQRVKDSFFLPSIRTCAALVGILDAYAQLSV